MDMTSSKNFGFMKRGHIFVYSIIKTINGFDQNGFDQNHHQKHQYVLLFLFSKDILVTHLCSQPCINNSPVDVAVQTKTDPCGIHGVRGLEKLHGP